MKEKQWHITTLLSAYLRATTARSCAEQLSAYTLVLDTARNAYRQSEQQASGGVQPFVAPSAVALLLWQGYHLAQWHNSAEESAASEVCEQMMRLVHQLLLAVLEYEAPTTTGIAI